MYIAISSKFGNVDTNDSSILVDNFIGCSVNLLMAVIDWSGRSGGFAKPWCGDADKKCLGLFQGFFACYL